MTSTKEQWKHTKGPWRVDGTRAVYGMVNGSLELVAKCAFMPCINGSDDFAAERGADMERANARLIAAAPSMLQALEEVVSLCEAYKGHPIHNDKRVTDARAVIAQAKGKA